jgi:AraC family transcriptional regulator
MQSASSGQPQTNGRALADSFGCPLNKLSINESIQNSQMKLYRKSSPDTHLGRIQMEGNGGGFLVGLSLADGHVRRLDAENQGTTHRFGNGSIYIRDLTENYRADVSGAFDFVLFDIPLSSILDTARDAGLSGVQHISTEMATHDPVLTNLTLAILPALRNPQAANSIFIDQMTSAITTHLVQTYGGQPVKHASRRATMSLLDERRAKEILEANLSGNLSIAEIATACDMSRGHFIRLFREATGVTPHQWLIQARINKACDLLRRPDLTIAEVGAMCGFSDQSHFTRVFATAVGVPPGTWRRSL